MKIIVIEKEGHTEHWRSLRDLCNENGWKENTLYRKKFPFEYKGYKLSKKELKHKLFIYRTK